MTRHRDSDSNHDMSSCSIAMHVHLPHHQTKSYSPATKTADISRLLDPAYASASSSSSDTSRYEVYVDHHGDLHDPDYRLFPVLPSHASQSPIKADRQRRGRQPSHASAGDPFYSFRDATRPSWELSHESAVADDDEEYFSEGEQRRSYTHHNGSGVRRSSSLSRRQLRSPASLTAPFYPTSGAASYNHTYTSYSSSASPIFSAPLSSPSLDSDTYVNEDAYSLFDEKDSRVLKKKARKVSASCPPSKKHRSEKPRSSIESVSPFASPFSYDDADADVEDSLQDEGEQQQQRATAPTCGEALKKEWQAVSLRMRIGVFRMKRRVRGALTS